MSWAFIWKRRSLPFTPGWDVVGAVDEIGRRPPLPRINSPSLEMTRRNYKGTHRIMHHEPHSRTRVGEDLGNGSVQLAGGYERYQLPAGRLTLLQDRPEQHSARVLASFDPANFASLAAYTNTVFSDPAHGLLSPVERELVGVVVSALNACVSCLISMSTSSAKLSRTMTALAGSL